MTEFNLRLVEAFKLVLFFALNWSNTKLFDFENDPPHY
jgi:hypothetical protein